MKQPTEEISGRSGSPPTVCPAQPGPAVASDGQTMRPAAVCRLTDPTRPPRWTTDLVAAEQAVTIMVDEVGSYTLLCTPSDVEALAVGFAFSEGMIDTMEDCLALSVAGPGRTAVAIKVEEPSRVGSERNLIVASSCGFCGTRNLEKVLEATPPCGRTLKVPPELLVEVTEQLKAKQELFLATGGTHATGIFTADGEFIAIAEDLGRHNALDKAIGKCLLAGRTAEGCGAAVSGRVSFEIAAKAARAGIELIVAVSAPSSFAVEAAQRWNVTLCGFVRPGRANVYTHPERIEGLPVQAGLAPESPTETP